MLQRRPAMNDYDEALKDHIEAARRQGAAVHALADPQALAASRVAAG